MSRKHNPWLPRIRVLGFWDWDGCFDPLFHTPKQKSPYQDWKLVTVSNWNALIKRFDEYETELSAAMMRQWKRETRKLSNHWLSTRGGLPNLYLRKIVHPTAMLKAIVHQRVKGVDDEDFEGKLRNLEKMVRSNQLPFVFADDELFRRIGADGELIEQRLDKLGVPYLLLYVDPSIGLTPQHFRRAAEFERLVASRDERVMPGNNASWMTALVPDASIEGSFSL